MMSSDELETLRQSCDQFISINSFFSTSTDKKQALSFLNSCDVGDNLEPVLFQIDANPTLATSKPFADVSAYSEFTDESEILFMLGSIFHLKSIRRSSNGQVWIVRMTLCSDDQHNLKQVLIYMKQQLGSGETDLETFGKLLWEMGKFDLAEKYFIRCLEQHPLNNPLLARLYEDLAKVAAQKGDYDKCMEWRQKAITIGPNQPTFNSNSKIAKPSSST
ncbi:unnamed protein product, partial [Rotaria magnacalcarata]